MPPSGLKTVSVSPTHSCNYTRGREFTHSHNDQLRQQSMQFPLYKRFPLLLPFPSLVVNLQQYGERPERVRLVGDEGLEGRRRVVHLLAEAQLGPLDVAGCQQTYCGRRAGQGLHEEGRETRESRCKSGVTLGTCHTVGGSICS